MKKTTFLSVFILLLTITSCQNQKQEKNLNEISIREIQQSEKLLGLEFTSAERDTMLDNIRELKTDYDKIRKAELGNTVRPALIFNPIPPGFKMPQQQKPIDWEIKRDVYLPEDKAELAFYPVYKLASLIRSGKISSVELTNIYLQRLRKYGDTLQAVVSLTEDIALEQARRADSEIARGIYRGPLHGIPFGVKDLLSVKAHKTSWGAMPFKDQQLEETATVVQKLEEAGAVLVAKLTLGALAMGDVWYGGVTKNPWDLEQGSSGSSAGSAASVSAGLVAFAIGTETWGSIVSPSTRCGVTGLRPTFGRVSKHGAMALSWSMDKIGPICRNAYDCAMVFDAIYGTDPKDPSTIEAPFNFDLQKEVKKLRVAYIKSFFEADYRAAKNDSITLARIRKLGFEPEAVEFPDELPVSSMAIILNAEAAAAFDELTRSNRDSLLVAQHKDAWPNIFRYSRFIPAVEYVNANRLRTKLIKQLHDFTKDYDVIITPSFGGDQLLATNLTGNPCVVIPNGFDEEDHPTSISFIGNLFDEEKLLLFAKYIQENTEWEDKHPGYFME